MAASATTVQFPAMPTGSDLNAAVHGAKGLVASLTNTLTILQGDPGEVLHNDALSIEEAIQVAFGHGRFKKNGGVIGIKLVDADDSCDRAVLIGPHELPEMEKIVRDFVGKYNKVAVSRVQLFVPCQNDKIIACADSEETEALANEQPGSGLFIIREGLQTDRYQANQFATNFLQGTGLPCNVGCVVWFNAIDGMSQQYAAAILKYVVASGKAVEVLMPSGQSVTLDINPCVFD